MKTCIRVLLVVMSVLILSGCGKDAEPASPQSLGTLAAIEYSRRVDMVWGENYSVRVSPSKIVFVEYFVEEDSDYRFETGISLKEDQWQQLETAVLELLPGLTEIKPQKEPLWKRLFKKEEPFLLDGADSSTLCLDWETEEGIVSVSYSWKNDDPKAHQLIDLLYALQENSKGE